MEKRTEIVTAEKLELLPLAERQRLVGEGPVTDPADVDPEFLARVRLRARELLEDRGIELPQR